MIKNKFKSLSPFFEYRNPELIDDNNTIKNVLFTKQNIKR